MPDPSNAVDNIVTVDGWEILGTSEFATPDAYLEYRRAHWNGMVIPVLMDALASYANESGVMERFWPPDFHDIHLQKVLVDEEDQDDKTYALHYNQFAAVVILEYLFLLMKDGLLAHRGNGDSASYRLALPRAGS